MYIVLKQSQMQLRLLYIFVANFLQSWNLVISSSLVVSGILMVSNLRLET